MKDCLNIIVQENKTLSHAFKHQDLVFMNTEVLRLLWSSNSSDLNMIESCWFWMKKKITQLDASRTRVAIIKAWFECWTKQLTHERIQDWIERISRHIQHIIELNKNNEYREDKEDDVVRFYDRQDRRIKYLREKRDFLDNEDDDDVVDVADVTDVDHVDDVSDISDDDDWDENLSRLQILMR